MLSTNKQKFLRNLIIGFFSLLVLTSVGVGAYFLGKNKGAEESRQETKIAVNGEEDDSQDSEQEEENENYSENDPEDDSQTNDSEDSGETPSENSTTQDQEQTGEQTSDPYEGWVTHNMNNIGLSIKLPDTNWQVEQDKEYVYDIICEDFRISIGQFDITGGGSSTSYDYYFDILDEKRLITLFDTSKVFGCTDCDPSYLAQLDISDRFKTSQVDEINIVYWGFADKMSNLTKEYFESEENRLILESIEML